MEEIKKIRLKSHLPNSGSLPEGGPPATPGVTMPHLAPIVLTKPEVEAYGQHDEIGQDARNHENAGGDLLIHQRNRVERGGSKAEDDAKDTELGRREEEVGDPPEVREPAACGWLGDRL